VRIAFACSFSGKVSGGFATEEAVVATESAFASRSCCSGVFFGEAGLTPLFGDTCLALLLLVRLLLVIAGGSVSDVLRAEGADETTDVLGSDELAGRLGDICASSNNVSSDMVR
jgi:hypothetical protein